MNNQSTNKSPDLSSIAHQTMVAAGFFPDVPPSVSEELRSIEARKSLPSDSTAKDLRALLWSSIDNSSSRDLDQVEYAESRSNGDICLMVGIADVDMLVQKGSAIDDYAGKNGTSVYTGVKTFSMLPEELSTDMTSLVDGADRSSIVMEMVVDKDGAVKSTDVYQARLRNRAKLAYESVGAWLDKNGEIPQRIASVPGMEAQVRLQLEAAKRLHEVRKQNGALELETIESIAVLNNKGQVTDLAVTERNSARDIIENFMIAANVAKAQFLEARGTVSLRRVVRTPIELLSSRKNSEKHCPQSRTRVRSRGFSSAARSLIHFIFPISRLRSLNCSALANTLCKRRMHQVMDISDSPCAITLTRRRLTDAMLTS